MVLQHDRFNPTRLATTLVVAITSRLRYASIPGNVRLARGKPASVVNVTQIATVDRADLGDRLGRLSRSRLIQVWDGVRLVLAPDL